MALYGGMSPKHVKGHADSSPWFGWLQRDDGAPQRSLRSFQRTQLLQPGEQQEVVVQLIPKDFQLADASGSLEVALGRWRIEVGSLATEVWAETQGGEFCVGPCSSLLSFS